MFKRIIKSDGFRIYFWPIFACYLFTGIYASLFMPVEPGSQKEAVFVFMVGAAWILCLWILVARYHKVKGKSVGKRAVVLLTVVSAIFLLGLILTAVIKILQHLLITIETSSV